MALSSEEDARASVDTTIPGEKWKRGPVKFQQSSAVKKYWKRRPVLG